MKMAQNTQWRGGERNCACTASAAACASGRGLIMFLYLFFKKSRMNAVWCTKSEDFVIKTNRIVRVLGVLLRWFTYNGEGRVRSRAVPLRG